MFQLRMVTGMYCLLLHCIEPKPTIYLKRRKPSKFREVKLLAYYYIAKWQEM